MQPPLFHRAIERLANRSGLDAPGRNLLQRLLDVVPVVGTRCPVAATPPLHLHTDLLDSTADTERMEAPPAHHGGSTPLDTLLPLSRTGNSTRTNPFRADATSRTRTTTPPDIPMANRRRLGRFVNLGLLGRGGMGEIYRVRDPELDRRMVLKVLRRDRTDDQESIARFLEEARLTSQLHHPGIVPVHETGTIDENRHFFTMREVRGETLDNVIDETHRNWEHADEDRNWSAHFHGLLDIFFRICEPIAYAHSRGIIHRDLKPSNIMVGDFGQVQILDWGLAKSMDDDDPDRSPDPLDETSPSRRLSPFDTHQGTIVGTPAYMPPEQARGDLGDVGPASDVYALGAILFRVLDGQEPFSGRTATSIVFQVLEGLQRRPGGDIAPESLVELCMQSMALDPDDRPDNASRLAEAVDQWRTGSHRRKKAMELVESADQLIPRIEQLQDRARRLRRRSRRQLQQIPDSAPVDQKRPAWAMEDEAELLDREAGTYRAKAIQNLDAALTHVPDLEEAHDRLARIYQRDHLAAERHRDQASANALEVFLRAHNTGKWDDYLEGRGSLNLRTRPPGARVNVFRFIQQNRRLHPGLERLLGHAPLVRRELAMGSYLLEIAAAGRATVRYPVYVSRTQNWTGTAPDRDEPHRIYLPFDDELTDDEIYVPAGPFWRGGDERASNSPPRSIRWLDSFVIQQYPVSHRDYLQFLNALLDAGRDAEARRHCPRDVGHIGHGGGTTLYRRDETGRFCPRSDDPRFLRLPVCLIDWHAARAYARWHSHTTGKRWRLPTTEEWEKAARGVDGRFFPWGDYLDPTWCRMVRSTVEAPGPVPVDAYPSDESPYGMRGAAGNIRDWCLPADPDQLDEVTDNTLVPFRGGCWFSTPEMCRIAVREFKPPSTRSAGIGIRLARDFP